MSSAKPLYCNRQALEKKAGFLLFSGEAIIIIIIIKKIYRAQDRLKATSALCQQWKLSTVQMSTVYTQQLNRNVFSYVLKVSTETSVDHRKRITLPFPCIFRTSEVGEALSYKLEVGKQCYYTLITEHYIDIFITKLQVCMYVRRFISGTP